MFVALVNKKGGVGKSTIAVHLACSLFDAGKSVAFLDADEQCSSLHWLEEAAPEMACVSAYKVNDCLKAAQKLIAAYDWVIADGPAGLDDISRTLLLLADLAVFPITPSILDVRSLSSSISILEYARGINDGRPDARLVLSRMAKRGRISNEIASLTPSLGIKATKQTIRELMPYRNAPQQGRVVSDMGSAAQSCRHGYGGTL